MLATSLPYQPLLFFTSVGLTVWWDSQESGILLQRHAQKLPYHSSFLAVPETSPEILTPGPLRFLG